MERHPHQHRRHAGPRRFRRRGRTHPAHGRRRAGAGRRRRRPAAADQVRGRQGAQARPEADRGHQQGRPAGRARDRSRERSVRSVRRARRHRRAARLSDPLRLGQAGLDGGQPRRSAGSGHEAAVRSGAAPCAGADGRGRSVPPARHHSRSQSLSRPRRHRPHLLGLGEAEPARQGAGRQRQRDRAGPHLQGAGVPRPRAHGARRSLCRRHRLDRRPAGSDRRAHHLRTGSDGAAAGAADRSADAGHDLPRQRFAARRHRRIEGDEPHDPRSPAARSRRQCRAARLRIRRQGRDGSRRPRRIAARHPDRDHAPRRLRIVGVAAEGAAPPQRRPANWKSRSKRS